MNANNRNKNHSAVSAADLESTAGHALLGTQKIERLDTPCRIHILSRRHRLTDQDGISAKYAIDGLIYAGLLRDDSPRWVKEVSYSQEKISSAEEESTVVTIEILD